MVQILSNLKAYSIAMVLGLALFAKYLIARLLLTALAGVSKMRGLAAVLMITVGFLFSADVWAETFETFNTGVSVNGQGGWTVADPWGYDFVSSGKPNNLDEQIVDDGTGNKVWRVSNAYTYSEYSAQPFSQTTPLVAGETGSSLWNDRGPDHTSPYNPPHYGANAATDRFRASFDFRSATGAAQPGLQLAISASAKQSTARQTWLQIYDNGTSGFNLSFYDTNVGDYTDFVTGLSYSGWHNIDMQVQFVDGVVDINGYPYTLQPGDTGFNASDVYGNDIVRLYVDGQLQLTASTWEAYYYSYNDAHPAPTLQAVDSLLFRMSGTAAPATLGNGVYFDNVLVTNEVPEPSSFALISIGVLTLWGASRRKQHR